MKIYRQKLIFTAHIATSLGWLGSVAAFLALAIAGIYSQNDQIVRSSYIAMNVIGQFVIVPLALTSLLIGVVQALTSNWGLTKYYWVLAKFGLTVFAVAVLLAKLRIMAKLARAAKLGQIMGFEFHHEKAEMIVHSAGGLIVLLIITVISVYKPWGRTRGQTALQV